ncbi:MAG: dTDP-4-dehydrorhamnose reductase [Verrucomicrobia bacterium]|nr:MAG: dTDP-4-dehydrorhamnose reductase [Verrucomicrobiota bacterium]
MEISLSAITIKMKIVVLGTGGRLGAALLRKYGDKFDVAGFDRTQVDLSDLNGVREKLQKTRFDVLINAAGFTKVDLCETHPDRAFLINAEALRVLAEICSEKSARLIHFSTDYVFDGEKRAPYTEEDRANPISTYGESKLAGEKNVLAAENGHLVVRVSWVFGPDRPSFIDAMIKRAQQDEKIDAIFDKFSTPTYTHDVARILPQFFHRDVQRGILHFANTGKCSWQEYAQSALDCCRDAGIPLKAKTVGALKLADMKNWVARRPVYAVLTTGKYTELTGMAPRAWREAVADYITRFYSKK